MVRYDSSRDDIITLGGRVISVARAEQLVRELEAAIETAHKYRDSPELHDIGLNERALNHLLSPAEEDYVLKVGVSYDESADLAMDYLTDVLRHSEKYGNLDAHINAPDIPSFFAESDGLTGFHVELPETSQ